VIESDAHYVNEYRNKVEFTIGRRYEDNEICVGFNKGNINKGIIFVDYPDKIKVISNMALWAAKTLEKVVKESGLEPYDRIKNEGFWRILLYRESKRTMQILISVVVTEPKEEEKAKLDSIKKALNEQFQAGSQYSGYHLVSLSMIYSTEISGGYKE
jgi:tRNA/tmRNA/rRNA uracil-C5-methylase (TrmA/RlmC/RlmD family)